MEEFNKFSIDELNTGIFIIDEFLDKNSPDTSLQNLRDLMKEEIEKRTHLGPIEKRIENLRAKYLGKYMGYVSGDSIKYFKVDEIEHLEDLDIITIGSKFIIVLFDDDYINIQYTTEPCSICNLNPQNIDMRDFLMSSEDEFKRKLNKIINDGLA
jgi:hypothetical protein